MAHMSSPNTEGSTVGGLQYESRTRLELLSGTTGKHFNCTATTPQRGKGSSLIYLSGKITAGNNVFGSLPTDEYITRKIS